MTPVPSCQTTFPGRRHSKSENKTKQKKSPQLFLSFRSRYLSGVDTRFKIKHVTLKEVLSLQSCGDFQPGSTAMFLQQQQRQQQLCRASRERKAERAQPFSPIPAHRKHLHRQTAGGAMLQSRWLILPPRHRDASDSDSTLTMTQQWRVEQKLQRHSGAAEIPSRSGTTSNKSNGSKMGIRDGFKPFICNMPMRLGSRLTSLEADCSFNPLQDVKCC